MCSENKEHFPVSKFNSSSNGFKHCTIDKEISVSLEMKAKNINNESIIGINNNKIFKASTTENQSNWVLELSLQD